MTAGEQRVNHWKSGPELMGEDEIRSITAGVGLR